jgi:hypothetical protein
MMMQTAIFIIGLAIAVIAGAIAYKKGYEDGLKTAKKTAERPMPPKLKKEADPYKDVRKTEITEDEAWRNIINYEGNKK